MIAETATSKGITDLRCLPKATPAQIKANKSARNWKYRTRNLPPWGFHPKPWTPQENELVRHKNGHSDRELSKRLGRSVTSIQIQRLRLKKGKK